jgi:fructuronate reductase
VSPRLNLDSLPRLPALVRRPDYDFKNTGVGIVHLGVGAFHRAHQALFTEDALRFAGGHWGILGASLRHAALAETLTAQDNLYTVETLGADVDYRIVAVIRAALCSRSDPTSLLSGLAARRTHIVTLTVTEKGYCFGADGTVDFTHADIAHDLLHLDQARSAIGWLVRGFDARYRSHGCPMTVISCDNLQANGARLADAVIAFVERCKPEMLNWLKQHVAFPTTVVDCIVPAATDASRARVRAAIDVEDSACVQREAFSQWVIQNCFAGPHPAWDRVGVQIVEDVGVFGQLKLHVLNACHSALAYLGLPRGHSFVRQAMSDPELAKFLDNLVATEIAPALPQLPVLEYWRAIRPRFNNAHLEHRLAQIAEDGSAKLAERIFPLLIINADGGIPLHCLARIVRGWLELAASGKVKDPCQTLLSSWLNAGTLFQSALEEPSLFPDGIRSRPKIRASIVDGT